MSQAPQRIKLHRKTQILEVAFGSQVYKLSAEYLRVHSPSAEVKGHGPGQEILQLNKAQVAITRIEPQGNYAIRLCFSDGHESGIYTWEYLSSLGKNHTEYWQQYLEKVASHTENEEISPVKWMPPS